MELRDMPGKKILLSAFECVPNRGSDAEVGWQWAISLAEAGHEVWVLTREVHRKYIEQEFEHAPIRQGVVHFIYFDYARFLSLTKNIKGRIYLYYYLWQWGAYRLATALHKQIGFDVVHHVTWVSVRQPSFMGGLGIPFYFGPVAGGEAAPWRLRLGYNIRQWLQDLLRDIFNAFVKVDPLMWWTFYKAKIIYVTSTDTLRLLPSIFRGKAQVELAIAHSHDPSHIEAELTQKKNFDRSKMRLLYVGRFIGWKGMHLGLMAMRHLLTAFPGARLTLVGRGLEEKHWKTLASSLMIEHALDWVEWVDHSKLSELYAAHDVFLFPSLHDSGGIVVLEALSYGLPVVCLDLGGPAVIVNDGCGVVLSTRGKSAENVAEGLAKELRKLAENVNLREKLSAGAVRRAKEFRWNVLVNKVHGTVMH